MEHIKIILKNVILLAGTTITWIDSLEAVFRVIVTMLTALVAILTIDKLWRERRKKDKGL